MRRLRRLYARVVCRLRGHRFGEWQEQGAAEIRLCERRGCAACEMRPGEAIRLAAKNISNSFRELGKAVGVAARSFTTFHQAVALPIAASVKAGFAEMADMQRTTNQTAVALKPKPIRPMATPERIEGGH